MTVFMLTRPCLGADIAAQAAVLDEGIHVLLTGGECSHVRAVALARNGELVACPAFPGHREQAVSECWACALSKEMGACAAVACGIHYDSITPEGIQEVLDVCDMLLEETLRRIKEEGLRGQ